MLGEAAIEQLCQRRQGRSRQGRRQKGQSQSIPTVSRKSGHREKQAPRGEQMALRAVQCHVKVFEAEPSLTGTL